MLFSTSAWCLNPADSNWPDMKSFELKSFDLNSPDLNASDLCVMLCVMFESRLVHCLLLFSRRRGFAGRWQEGREAVLWTQKAKKHLLCRTNPL